MSDYGQIEASEDIGVNTSTEPSMGQIIERHLSRRGLLKGLAATTALGAMGALVPTGFEQAEATIPGSAFKFKELGKSYDANAHVADGYDIQTLIRWGDKVEKDAPAFDVLKQTGAAQSKQFGYNCDFVGYLPLPFGSKSSDHGLLAVNHEYTIASLMFPGLPEGDAGNLKTSPEQVEVEMQAHGLSVIEIRRTNGKWDVVEGSKYARRITAHSPFRLTGPAAGHDRLKTSADATGTMVAGTLNNCAGGVTPWGTVLSGEENFNGYFSGDVDKAAQAAEYKRYGLAKASFYNWSGSVDRFNVNKEPNEPNRFGWIVEIDPYDPTSTPKKRTALGRLKHEGANVVIDKSGHVVAYMGDDERFEYVYKFISKNKYDPANRAANMDLLDEGTLFVGQFADDGKVIWLPLVQGQAPLTAENGFASQADVLLNTRKAADLVKATPMDRPEDVEAHPTNGKVYVMLTNNNRRTAEQVTKANPRAVNNHGHVVEISTNDHTASEAKWSLLLVAGKPGVDHGAQYHRATSDDGWLSCPDNCAIDSKGRLWISTDGMPSATGVADGLFAVDTDGTLRGKSSLFFQAPSGAEICGPFFTPDDTTLFLAIQHPGEDKGSTFDKPSTRWPDFKDGMPPRPSVIAITRKGGGPIAV
jgi:secreted PhoX family phosphatase